jgi:hypothetical protein
MAGDTVVVVRAGESVFVVITSFARLPVPGEHVLLALSDAQRAQLGAEYGYGRTRHLLPVVVRDTILRQKDQWQVKMPGGAPGRGTIAEHIADVFGVAITTEAWHEKLARWAPGDDGP